MPSNPKKILSQPIEVIGDVTADNFKADRADELASGGGNVYARHGYFGGSPGGVHINDAAAAGVEIFKFQADAAPADNILFEVKSGLDAFQVNVTDANFTFFSGVSVNADASPSAFTTTGTTNDWTITNFAQVFRIRQDLTGLGTTRTITGLAGGTAGKIITIINIASVTTRKIVLAANNAGSSAANRFGFGFDVTLNGLGDSVSLIYDATSSLWRLFSSRTPLLTYATSLTYAAGVPGTTPFTVGQEIYVGATAAAYTITGNQLQADTVGNFRVEVYRATYGAFPTYSSISGTSTSTGGVPKIVSPNQKNTTTDVSLWTSTALNMGDALKLKVINNDAGASWFSLLIFANRTIP
jgi:hypothetical protein